MNTQQSNPYDPTDFIEKLQYREILPDHMTSDPYEYQLHLCYAKLFLRRVKGEIERDRKSPHSVSLRWWRHVSTKELSQESGLPQRQARNILNKIHKTGRVEKRNHGRNYCTWAFEIKYFKQHQFKDYYEPDKNQLPSALADGFK